MSSLRRMASNVAAKDCRLIDRSLGITCLSQTLDTREEHGQNLCWPGPIKCATRGGPSKMRVFRKLPWWAYA